MRLTTASKPASRARFLALQAMIALGAASTAPVSAAVLVNDQFNDGAVSNGTDPLDLAWAAVASTSLSITPFDTLGNTSNSLRFNNTRSGNTGPFPVVTTSNFTAATLNVGNSVKMTFDLRATGALPNGGGAFRFALGDDSESHTFSFGSGVPVTPSGGFAIYPANIVNGTPISTLSTAPTTGAAINDKLPHTFTLKLTRLNATTLLYNAVVDSKNFFATRTVASNFAGTAKKIVMGQGGFDDVDFNVDNVLVQTNVSEIGFTTGTNYTGLADRGDVTTTGATGKYVSSVYDDAAGTSGQAAGYVDVAGAFPTPAGDVPAYVLLDFNTATGLDAFLGTLDIGFGSTSFSFSTGTAGTESTLFNELAAAYAGTDRTWDALLRFDGLPADAAAGSLDFNWNLNAASGFSIDKVALVPEPSTLAVFSLGIAGILGRRRRSHK